VADDVRDATFDLIARDKTERAARTARKNMERVRAAARRAQRSMDWDKVAEKLGKRLLGVARAASKVTATVAAAASAVGPLTAGMVAATKATVAFGKATVALAPLAAFLPSLAGSVGLVVGTLKLAGPGLAKALRPVTDAFFDADGEAGALTRRLRSLIVVGVEPLAKQFAKVNLPTVAAGMDRIAVAANGVVLGFGRWVNTAEGQGVIATIVNATASAAERLGPKVTAAAVALGRLAGRAGDKAITGFADLVGRILDKFTAWANGTSMDDINAALDTMRGRLGQARDRLADMRGGLEWLVSHQGEIKTVSNVLAGLAVVVGASIGNWPAVLAGAIALIVNNLGGLRSALSGSGSVVASVVEKLHGLAAIIMTLVRNAMPEIQQRVEDLKRKWDENKASIDKLVPLLELTARVVGTVVVAALLAATVVISGLITWLAQAGEAWADLQRGANIAIMAILTVLGHVVHGAAAAFGWIPGIGEKLRNAAAEFDKFRNRVNDSLSGIRDQTVSIALVTKANGVSVGEGGTRPGGRGGAFAGTASWRPAQVMAAVFGAGGLRFATAGGGTSRTGGPTPVQVDQTLNVSLDGRPFREMTARAVDASERRQAWRARVGRR
jgi:hypothetical protein